MNEKSNSFQAGIDFENVLKIISKQIYDTPMAFIRENVQNAVDAIRIQAHRDKDDPGNDAYKIDITVENKKIIVNDNGLGMTSSDLKNYFWTIGASGKRTQEALSAGCVGTFGIGGFANFGVCEALEVISRTKDSKSGTLTRLSEEDIQKAGTTIPEVTMENSTAISNRGTIVIGYLRNEANIDELHKYLKDFIQYVPSAIYFNGEKISQKKMSDINDRKNLIKINTSVNEWQNGDVTVFGELYEDRGHTIVADINGISIGQEYIDLVGLLRFENGPINVFKNGFKLCATHIGCTIGVSGRMDCNRFTPTAGRDSLDSTTTSLLSRIVTTLEKTAVDTVLESPERIAQHTRIFRYIIRSGLIDRMDKVNVRLADGSESTLGDIKIKSVDGGIGVFFGLTQKQALSQIMQARGHIVVLLSSDRHRQNAERQYLERFCDAKAFDGMIECIEFYKDLNRFEKVFLSELELNIGKSYEVKKFSLIAGKLTEDIPVFVKEYGGNAAPEIFVDVRHNEVNKLQDLGFTRVLYSLIATFCREYLGPTLKKWSPRFFGNGALNLELLAKRRSELWILLTDDIGIVQKGTQRQVVTSSDVQVVNVHNEQNQPEQQSSKRHPRIINVIDEQNTTGLAGFYIRLPDTAYNAYGDLIPQCDSRGVVWAGNKILYVASDGVSAAFQYEIRLDEIVAASVNGNQRAEGALEINKPVQEMYDGLYFYIPESLEIYLVPSGDEEIRLELRCDWIDMRTAKNWIAKEN